MTRATAAIVLLFAASVAGQNPAPTDASVATPNFAEHIAPLIHSSCTECHRPQGAGPFALVTYRDVAKRADMLKVVIDDRYMPPWHPDPKQSHEFIGNRRLTNAQIAMFSKWIAAGKPEGDASKTPRPPTFEDGWTLGKPDLVVEMKRPYEVPADGRDQYRFFRIPVNLPEDKWVKAVEMRPTARSAVHHALFFLTEASDDDDEGETGRRGFGGLRGFRGGLGGGDLRGGLERMRGLGGYVPGSQPRFLRDDLALKLPRGMDLLVQVHFHPTGKKEVEQSQFGLYFTDKKPSHGLRPIQLPAFFGFMAGIDIPAGEKNYTVEDEFKLPIDVEGISVGGHAHFICKSMLMTATFPDGKVKNLLNIPDWDMDWQTEYHYKDKQDLPAGTLIKVKIVYDNSAENSDNPNQPPIRVRWGRQSTDEMGSMTLRVIAKNEAEADILEQAMADAVMDSLRKRFERGGFGRRNGGGNRRRRGIDRFDRNKDGQIVADELPSSLRKIYMRRWDKNKDGVIDAEEMKGNGR